MLAHLRSLAAAAVIGLAAVIALKFAMIPVDPEYDLGIVVMNNFPGEKADEAALETARALYGQHGPGAREQAR
jgi:hypothetical protein